MKETKNDPLMVKIDHLSVHDLRQMAVGQELKFVLTDRDKLPSARSTCNNEKMYGRVFSARIKPEESSITVRRMPDIELPEVL